MLAEARTKANLSNFSTIQAIVKDGTASCIAPSGTTVKARIPDASLTHNGGIGFVVYDDTANNAEGIINKVEVSLAK